ncbi:hypothetical protein HK102_007845 [Quaeritorhiza haematococci]|nr:hypothetical protein HK102_007845 [Quaeritorhiza haematococci]
MSTAPQPYMPGQVALPATVPPPGPGPVPPPGMGPAVGQDARERKVMHPYEPTMPDEVRLTPGEAVIVLETYPDQWARMFLPITKETGMAPLGCLEGPELHLNPRLLAPEVLTAASSPSPPSPYLPMPTSATTPISPVSTSQLSVTPHGVSQPGSAVSMPSMASPVYGGDVSIGNYR